MGRLLNPSMLKRAESHRSEANKLGIFACNLACFKGFSKGFMLENCLQNLNRMTDFKK